jgi:hypothetical protein
LTRSRLVSKITSIPPEVDTMSRVNLTRQVKTDDGWKRVVLERDSRGRVRRASGEGRYLIEWREGGRRLRGAGATPAEAPEAQRRLELEARENNFELLGLPKEQDNILLDCALQNFLRNIKAFRKLLTPQKYEYVVALFFERVTPKKFAREIPPEAIKGFLAWRKSKGLDPGTTLCTDRVILHNFFSTLKIDNPAKEVPRSLPVGFFPGV